MSLMVVMVGQVGFYVILVLVLIVLIGGGVFLAYRNSNRSSE
jgi:cytochrome bd-type quinol oxidase subunit 2